MVQMGSGYTRMLVSVGKLKVEGSNLRSSMSKDCSNTPVSQISRDEPDGSDSSYGPADRFQG